MRKHKLRFGTNQETRGPTFGASAAIAAAARSVAPRRALSIQVDGAEAVAPRLRLVAVGTAVVEPVIPPATVVAEAAAVAHLARLTR